MIAAVVAAIVALRVPFITAKRQRLADQRKDKITAVAEFAGKYAATIHQIQWLTWRAHEGIETTELHVKEYDADMHTLYPDLIAAFAKAVAFSPELRPRLQPLLDLILENDTAIGRFVAHTPAGEPISAQKLAAIHTQTMIDWDAAPLRLAELVASIQASTETRFDKWMRDIATIEDRNRRGSGTTA